VAGGDITRHSNRGHLPPPLPPHAPQLPLLNVPCIELPEVGARWLASYVATTRNVKGQRLARYRFEHYVLRWLDAVPLRDLDGDHIREFRLVLENHWGLSPYTVTHVLSDLRCLLRWALSARLIERSPFPPRVMPRIAEVAPRGIT